MAMITSVTQDKMIAEWINEHLVEGDEGKYYPKSTDASDLLDLIVYHADPEDVFPRHELEAWAGRNGYRTSDEWAAENET
jgi:hypothetical protein